MILQQYSQKTNISNDSTHTNIAVFTLDSAPLHSMEIRGWLPSTLFMTIAVSLGSPETFRVCVAPKDLATARRDSEISASDVE